VRVVYLLVSLLGWVATSFFYMTHPEFGWQWIWLGAYVVLHLSFLPLLDQIFSKFSIKRGVFSLILAGAWVYSSHTHAFSSMGPLMAIVTVLTLFMFALSFYCLIYWLEKPFSNQGKRRPMWWWGVIYGLVPALIWFIYLLTYSPGKMTYDSFWQWDMAHRIMPYNAWHPMLHTWFIQATTWLYNSPAAYSVVQIVIVSAIVGYALYNLQAFGVPVIWVVLIDIVYALDPVNGFYVITMWKDIPFAAFILLLTVLFAKVVFSKGVWLKRPSHIIALILVAFIAMNLRDNGVEVVIAALVLFIAFVKGTRRRMAIVTVSVMILYFLFNGPLMNALHVIKNPLNQALAIPSQQIAATYKEHGHFTPELKHYFNQILPEENWVKDYNPYSADPIKHDPIYHSAVINQSFSTYLKNWASLLALNPRTFVSAYLNQVAVIWQFQSSANMNPYFTSGLDLQDYPLGIKLNAPNHNWGDAKPKLMKAAYQHYIQQTKLASPKLPVMSFVQYKKAATQTVAPLTTKSLLPHFKPVLDKVFRGVQHKTFKNYFLKGAIPLLLLLIGLIAAIRRRRGEAIGIFLPACFVLITIGMAMPAPDFRYSFSFIFTVPFLFLLGKLEVD
jgi:hypothetical protein